MSDYRIGSGYIGTDSIKTSTAMQEIIPTPPLSWSVGYKLYKFEFINSDQDCTVIINSTTTLFLRAGYGFEINESDQPITSFIIKEAGVTYTYTGFY